ncbi:MAG: class I SAM-dependent methyltransferase [Deltaproteobacteria bacterium]
MTDIPCPICDSWNHRVFSRRGKNRVVICRDCDLYFVNPITTDTSSSDAIATSTKYTDDQLAKQDFFQHRADVLLARIERRRPPGSLLDIGCAIGTELVAAKARGWACRGVELSAASLAIAQSRGLDVLSEPLEDCNFAEESFDLVTLNHVLEHVPRVELFLREVRRVLKKDGLLFIAVPNVHTWWFYLKRQRYNWAFNDDHYTHFSVRTLPKLLTTAGFNTVEISTSRWMDFHRPAHLYPAPFRSLNRLVERADLGIELFCLATRSADSCPDQFAAT